jgi:hypothetical protein
LNLLQSMQLKNRKGAVNFKVFKTMVAAAGSGFSLRHIELVQKAHRADQSADQDSLHLR